MSSAEIIRLYERPPPSLLRRVRVLATEELAEPAWDDGMHITNNLAAVLHGVELAAFLVTGLHLPSTADERKELLDDSTRATWAFACLYRDVERILWASFDYDYNARRVGARKAAQTRERKRAALQGA
jgi:hypothetical protein